MAKAKLTNFAQVLRLLSTLTDGEKATLRDVLRPEPAKRSARTATKKPKAAEAPAPLFTENTNSVGDEPKPEICGACGNAADYQDHFKPSPHYHPFESPSRAKSAGKKSSRSTGSTKANGSGPASSETLPDGVGNAVHAASSNG